MNIPSLVFTVMFWACAATVAAVPIILIWRDLFKTAPRPKGADQMTAQNQLLREAVTVTLFTEQAPDGTWCAQMLVSGLPSESVANAAVAHMEKLFCGQEIQRAD